MWYEMQAFWAHIVILGLIIFLSVMFNYIYKRKTNPMFVFLTQIAIPLILMSIMELIFFEWAFIVLDFLIIIALYGIFNFSYFWYNSHRKFDEEKSVELDFDGQEPQRDPYCRVYGPRYQVTGLSAYNHFEKHLDLIRRYSQDGVLRLVIEDYYLNLNPELSYKLKENPSLSSNESAPPTNKDDVEAQKQWEELQTKQFQQIETWEKTQFLGIMDQILKGWYLHLVYFRWVWTNTPKEWEDRDLHADVKVYLLSVEQKLPPTLIINAVCYYDDEYEDNKTFTCLLGVEGRRSELLTRRMNILERNLVIFRFFQLATVIEELERRVRYYEMREQRKVNIFEDLANKQLVYETRIQAAMPNTKKLSWIDELKRQNDVEVR